MKKIEMNPADYVGKELISFYKKVAELLGFDPDAVKSYDCVNIHVARNIQDAWFDTYREKGFSETDICMSMCLCFPRVEKTLKDNEILILDNFLEMKEEIVLYAKEG